MTTSKRDAKGASNGERGRGRGSAILRRSAAGCFAVALVACGSGERAPHGAPASASATPIGTLKAPLVSSLVLEASGDTFVRSLTPNQNLGGDTRLSLQALGRHRSLLFFDVPALRALIGSGTLLSARIDMNLASTGTSWGAGRPIAIHRLAQASSEHGATWACAIDANVSNFAADCAGPTTWSMNATIAAQQPWLSPPTATSVITNGQTGVVSFDVSADVGAILAGTYAGHGWLLKKVDEAQTGSLEFASREQGPAPRLVLEVEGAPPGGDPPGPVTGSATVLADRDTELHHLLPNQNFGNEGTLRIQALGKARALIGFDAAATLAALDGELVKARLRLPIARAFGNWGPDRALGVHRMRRAWTELGATWSCADDSNTDNFAADCAGESSWVMAGPAADLAWINPPTDTLLVASEQTGTLELDVTRDVACALAGHAPLQGWLVKKAMESQTGRIDLHSREAGQAPSLFLEWTDGNGVSVSPADCAVSGPPGSCTPTAPDDATCNGIDEDCDGNPDDDFAVAASSCGVGACASTGQVSCVSGQLVDDCAPTAPAPDDASCNGLDDDCDTVVDEDYAAIPTSCGVGACSAAGETSCVLGAAVDSCQPGTPATDDSTCNAADDDCDGAADEEYVPRATSCGIGACAASGATSCVAGQEVEGCTPGTPAPNDGACNALDDDCDGTADEDYVAVATTCGVGACSATGATSCVAGQVQNGCTPGAAASSDATCNGIDDDCDGSADEEYVATATSCGVGACSASGSTSCSEGTVSDSCAPKPAAPSDATCDLSDDDCDGVVDEEYVATATTCGVGACNASGSTSCVLGDVVDSCAPGEPAPADASCNGVDDDCNGTADEDYVPLATACGIGACSATGTTSCAAGQVVDGCAPGTPAAADATCDGNDDDCDGATDEEFAVSCVGSSRQTCAGGTPVSSDCSDTNPCNGSESCSGPGECQPGTPPPLDDENPCTIDACDPGAGVTHDPSPAGTSCGAHDQCDGNGSCVSVLPPDPADVAPPLPPGSVSLLERVRYMFEGDPPIQTGVAPGTIETRTVAVLRGRVLDRNDQPLPGVSITVHGHAEFGQTLSRLDGMFDLVVNGGSLLSLDYDREGFIGAQRTVDVPWQDHAFVDDVVLVPRDAAVTDIDFPSPGAQVHQAGTIVDERGARTAALYFPSGTSTELVMADGSRIEMPSLAIRATEFTVGPNGEQAMPAELPDTSAYTYAVELSADEADAIGAEHVEFSQPVSLYLDNFLEFPVGTVVPVGFYDRGAAVWKGVENGRVIAVLSIQAGLAEVDLDGDGAADDAAALAAAGITGEERATLAEMYAAGTELWRAAVRHFSPCDMNMPPILTDEGDGGDDPPPPEEPEPSDDPEKECSSVIEVQNQVLGETLPLTGTPFTLNYRSDRVRGSKAGRTIEIQVTGDSVSSTFRGGQADIRVAGQRHVLERGAEPGQVVKFTWDGKDAQGRELHGGQRADVRVGLKFPLRYAPAAEFRIAFAQMAQAGTLTTFAGGEATRWLRYQRDLHVFDGRQSSIGAWSLSHHHHYDPARRILYLGDGSRRSTDSIADTIQRFAGIASTSVGHSGDGGPALNARLNSPRSLAVGPDGAVYIGTRQGVRRVDPDTQIITTVAGGKESNNCSATLQDGPALDMCVAAHSLDFGRDGALYIGDNSFVTGGVDRVRRLDLQTGIISHVAGAPNTNGCSDNGDGGPARDAMICSIIGHASGPDGSIYVLDRGSSSAPHVIRKISPNGIIETIGSADWSGNDDIAQIDVGPDGSLYVTQLRTVLRILPTGEVRHFAGNLATGSTGDGGPAINARFGSIGPAGVTVGPDGRVFIADNGNRRVRLVDEWGIINRIAGLPDAGNGAIIGDGGSPYAAGLGSGVLRTALAPDGSLYLTARANNTVRVIRPTINGDFSGEMLVPSEDGREAYRFDINGRHLDTVHALTGGLLHSFGYDAKGLLTSTTDGDGNVTTIERDSEGRPTRIVAPFGHETLLATDANGYVSSVTDPAGAETELTYDAGGLLVGMVDVRGGQHAYGYDAEGRLIFDEDAANGRIELERQGNGESFTVTRTTAEGRQSTFGTETLATNVERRTNVGDDGLTQRADRGPDQSRSTTLPDGTVITTSQAPDPVWGLVRPLISSTERLPSGSTRVQAETRTAVLANPLDPRSLQSAVDTVTINGTTFTSSYDDASRLLTITSPEGRQRQLFFDEQGRVIELRRPGFVPSILTYDSSGHLTLFTQGARSMTNAYDARSNLISITDALGRTDTFAHDLNGRVTQQTRADGTVVAFGYDAAGNLTTVTPATRPDHQMSYTPTDLLETYVAPDVATGPNVTRYFYDNDSRPVQVLRPDGSSIETTYDAAGRVETISLPGLTTTFGYDPTRGYLRSMDRSDSVELDFVQDGDLITDEAWSGQIVGSVQHSYDTFRRIQRETVNGVNPVDFTYDDDGLLTGAGGLSLTYDIATPLLTGTQLGLITDARAHNGHGELTTYEASHDGSGIFSQTFVRDALGRVQQKSETLGGITSSYEYGYDHVGQLISVAIDGALIREYAYDANGNRLSVNEAGVITSATYDAQDRLLTYGDLHYTYTEDGALRTKTDMLTGDVTVYTYDALGALRAVDLPDGRSIEYVVDAMGRRVGKKVDGVLVQHWLYRNGLNPIAELDGTGAVVRRFVYGAQDNVPDYVVQGGATYRILSDTLGSPRLVVNVNDPSDVLADARYEEFGKMTGTGIGSLGLGFAGGLFDVDTGLTRFGARDFDPIVGRWTNKDPIRWEGQQANLYVYVSNDPINWSDPTGLEVCGSGWNEPLVPDVFPEACVRHDACYDDGRTPKDKCDEEIRNNAAASCGPLGPTAVGQLCLRMANTFHRAVSRFGGSAFRSARRRGGASGSWGAGGAGGSGAGGSGNWGAHGSGSW